MVVVVIDDDTEFGAVMFTSKCEQDPTIQTS